MSTEPIAALKWSELTPKQQRDWIAIEADHSLAPGLDGKGPKVLVLDDDGEFRWVTPEEVGAVLCSCNGKQFLKVGKRCFNVD